MSTNTDGGIDTGSPAAANTASPQGAPSAPPSAVSPTPPDRSALWTLPLLCVGLGLIACCLLLPQAEDNHRLAYERQKLRNDLEQVQRQLAVNDEFLAKVQNDPTLAERLAQRQMKVIRSGTSVLDLKPNPPEEVSPFLLVHVPPPPPMPEYQPLGGKFVALCCHPRGRLYIMGGGMLMVAAALVLGSSRGD